MTQKQRKNSEGKAKRLANLKPFKKGESGNPEGRPVGARNRATTLRKWLNAELEIVNPITKDRERGTVEDEVVLALIARARRGDVIAVREILDSVYGKQGNVNFNLTTEELRNLTDEELDALSAKFNR